MSFRYGLRYMSKILKKVVEPWAEWTLKFLEDWQYGDPIGLALIFSEPWSYGDPIGLELKFSESWSS